MHMLEQHDGPEHLVVFITSDQDFCEKIQELQRRNFKVVVLFHGPSTSWKPASITQVADESHDWLTFLKQELCLAHLSVAPYDPQAYQGANQAQNSMASARTTAALSRQASQESRHTARVSALALQHPTMCEHPVLMFMAVCECQHACSPCNVVVTSQGFSMFPSLSLALT